MDAGIRGWSKRVRIYYRLIHLLGVKEGLIDYPLSVRVRILRILFFFPERLKEQWVWWTKL